MLSNCPISRLAAAAVMASVIALAFFAIRADAKTAPEYREEVTHLKEDFAALISTDLDPDPEELARFEAEVFEEIKEFAADRDTVTFGGSDIAPDNAWILEKWNEYRSGKNSGEERAALFSYIYERLAAIEGKLIEYESAAETGAAKDENKRRLAEILNGVEFRGAPADADESFAARIMKWVEEWLRRMFPGQETPSPELRASGPGAFGYVLQILLYCFIAAAIGYLLYRFGPELLRRARDKRGKESGDRIVLGEKIEAGRSTSDLFSEAELLVKEGRLREGLRKGYIALLFGLGEKRRITLARHKTNRDYLNDLKSTEIHPRMSELTLQYERHWYGASSADESDWDRFAGGFTEVLEGRPARVAEPAGREK